MAKQDGIIKIRGTIGDVCFYKLNGEYLARKKSSLNGERVKRDPAFRTTMQHANLLAAASTIGSKVYHRINKGNKDRSLYQQITGEVMRLLEAGWDKEEAIVFLCKQYSNRKIG